ncbi:hypothetical protein BX666DRAFT_1979031 [Dichotomocladium elegans]|nr:hypothetical protein BX666DRAFT_1979031 [Dichotomocladium elegans]
MVLDSRSRYSRSPSPPRRRRRSPSYSRSRSRSPMYSSRSRSRSPRSRSRSPRSRSPRRSASPPPPRHAVEVTNLTRNVTAEHIKEIFGQYGTIKHIDFPMNAKLNTNTGRATVEYATKEEMEKAIGYMNDGQLDGKHLNVTVAPPPTTLSRYRGSLSPPRRRRAYSPQSPRSRRPGNRAPLPNRRGGGRYYRDRYSRSSSRSRSPVPRRGRRYSSYSRSRSRSYSPRGRSYSRRRSYSRGRSYSRSRSYDSRDYSSRSKSRSISPPPSRSRRSVSPRR